MNLRESALETIRKPIKGRLSEIKSTYNTINTAIVNSPEIAPKISINTSISKNEIYQTKNLINLKKSLKKLDDISKSISNGDTLNILESEIVVNLGRTCKRLFSNSDETIFKEELYVEFSEF